MEGSWLIYADEIIYMSYILMMLTDYLTILFHATDVFDVLDI